MTSPDPPIRIASFDRERRARAAGLRAASRAIRRRFALLLSPMVLLVLLVSPASAQTGGDGAVGADNIEKLEFERPVAAYACAGAFLLAAIGLGFKPSRRTHD